MTPKPSAQKFQVDHALDIRGVAHPAGYHQAKAALQGMSEDQILELHLDEGQALNSIPFALRAEGHEIVASEPVKEGVRLLVRKRALLS